MSGDDAARPVAWVTGASMGMGADTAVALAGAGFDLAITARTQHRLDAVADEVRATGARALPIASDLTERTTIESFADAALAEYGRCDLVCNIGIHKGEGMSQLLMETDLRELTISYEADVVAPVVLCQRAVASMLERGRGTIMNMSSASVYMEPPGTAHDNGWSFSYVAAKAGIDQMASIVNVELGAQGIQAFNVEPGFVAYGEDFSDTLRRYPGVPVSPPECIGPAVVWLATDPGASKFRSKRVNLPVLTQKLGLLPGWGGPGTPYESTRG